MASLDRHGGQARYVELDSDEGHMGALSNALRWEGALREFMERDAVPA